MKKSILMFAVLLMALVPEQLLAQGQQRNKGWDKNSPYCRLYDVANNMEIEGEIVEIKKFTPAKGASYGLELVVKTKAGNRDVHLGPDWYMEDQEMQLAVGDRIEVEGSEVDFDGRKVLMAAEVERGDQEMELRDDNGRPLWRQARE